MPLVKIPRDSKAWTRRMDTISLSLSAFQPSVPVPFARGIGISLFRETRRTIVESAACRRLTTGQAIVLALLTATQAYTPYT